MKQILGKIIGFIILVVLVLIVIAAIQYPQLWRHDWQNTRQYTEQKWLAMHQWWENQESTPPSTQSTHPPAVPVTSAAVPAKPDIATHPVPVAAPAKVRFPKNLTQSQYALLMAARQAFWNHNVKAAIADYHALIAQLPEVPELYGELGNIYYQTGHPLSAGKAYTGAARSLIAAHQYPSAAALLPLISSLDPNQATLIRQALAR
ncbi:hypothetical protein B1757_09945 [Acidithiobacillus marinus]|uniref:Tetratricopeptide repeat protein n=1 Tax=Acidithiobacillus marinus TaxID=187490 RepID=A0A2I1DKM1_9PROT|nr:hypothetical protein [Acidithiobacillus marinus]PKY10411.1 hypothetical protein B1757_09945 [Acidithiobacillus marinus]